MLAGIYIIFGRFLVDARRRSGIYYGVTKDRVIIISGTRTRQVKSLNLHMLSDLSMEERRDGSGTISFGAAHPMSAWGSGMSWPGMERYLPPSFESIPDVRTVYALIEEAQALASMPKE